jgi:pimeloyl-ACP methyl ester carboxylesterase
MNAPPMENYRTYGEAPYRTAVVHGGPGAAGEMAPVARALSSGGGVLEPMQTALTLEGQIRELRAVLAARAAPPVTLVGFSWGAWLALLCASRNPDLVGKLILVGCGPLEEQYAADLQNIRLARLDEAARREARRLMEALEDSGPGGRGPVLSRLGALFSRADAYDPIEGEPAEILTPIEPFQDVWREGALLRRSGRLLAEAGNLACPVVAIHGDYDPHPAEGVREPLSGRLADFRFLLLAHCGHKPWIERRAREEFYRILREEIR